MLESSLLDSKVHKLHLKLFVKEKHKQLLFLNVNQPYNSNLNDRNFFKWIEQRITGVNFHGQHKASTTSRLTKVEKTKIIEKTKNIWVLAIFICKAVAKVLQLQWVIFQLTFGKFRCSSKQVFLHPILTRLQKIKRPNSQKVKKSLQRHFDPINKN